MVGDYISTSFSGGRRRRCSRWACAAAPSAFDEAMYAPATPLAVASLAQSPNVASSQGAGPITGNGIGTAIQALKQD